MNAPRQRQAGTADVGPSEGDDRGIQQGAAMLQVLSGALVHGIVVELDQCSVHVLLEEQPSPSTATEDYPEDRCVDGYGVDYAGLLSLPGDEQGDNIASFQF